MRSNKGITLTSLIVYIIVFSVVIGTVATITGYFGSNTNDVIISTNSLEQYTKLTTYITNDINSINYKNIRVLDDYIDIEFLDGTHHIYIYNDEKIYYIDNEKDYVSKKIVLCKQVNDYKFSYEEQKLKISVTINGITYNNNYSI